MLPPDFQKALEELVFSPPNPYISLDSRLQPFIDLMIRFGDARAAQERDRIKEAVFARANALLAQIESSAISDDFRSGYKRGVNTALAAIRANADQPGA